MQNMKRKIYHISIFLLFWICEAAYSQNPEANILRQDLSGLFKDLSMTGVLGEDCSRIDIHFSEARKMDNREYGISGVSRTRLSAICPFEGKVCIDSVSSVPQMESECTAVDGFIYGHYSFVEYGDKRCSGVFSGSFKQGYRMNGKQVEKGRNEITELKLNLSEYRGKWKSAKGLAKVCSWADEIIPDTPTDFCQFNDAGEWIVSPQYRKNGWDNLYNAYHNENLTTDEVQKARAAEEQEWWADRVKASALMRYMEQQNLAKHHALAKQDTLYIETEKTEFEVLYRLCFNQQGRKNVVFELRATDDSSIDFVQSHTINGVRKFDCFAVYDNVADGNRFLFFDYESQAAYITPDCFSGFYPIYSSVDFSKAEVLLRNEHYPLGQSSDTLSIDSKVTYVPFDCNNRIIKARFVPCAEPL